MDDLDHPPIIDLNDHRSIAVRRKRRSTNNLNSHSRNNSASSATLNHGINTPPATPNTPKRSKKRVRFSDPGPNLLHAESSASSGLTPFIRRASLSSATKSSKRRHSTPATLSNRSQYHDEAPLSGTLQFAPLRQVLDGRVKRRLRRNRLSEEVNNIEWDKRHEARSRKLEVERLRNELRDKDMEMQSMRDEQDIASQLEGESGSPVTTTSRLSTRVSELEQQISELKAELERKESARHDESHWDPDWTMAAKDPFHDGDDEYEDDFMITNYDDDFGDGNDELMTTPTRLNTSFPSPPSTLPNTPCMQQGSSSPSRSSHSDAEKDALKSQLESLQSEIQKLTSTIAFKEDNHLRLTEKLSDYIPQDESHDHSTLDSALDTVLTQLALTQATCQERNAAFNALTSEISSLGFASSGPEETIQTIAQSFRKARLDLEYLTPGENPVGFENDKLLEMLVSRIKVLLEKVKERDDSIDQYHSQEVLLRQQLNTRVDALLDVQKELCLATSVVTDLRNEIEEKEIGTERLRSALDGYRDEVNGLEALICKMETQESTLRSQLSETEERLQDEVHSHETTRTCIQGNDILLSEYSNRLTTALQATATLQQEIHTLEQKHQEEKQTLQTLINDRDVSTLEREKKHGEDLALRDVRINQLRTEMERVNAALHSAHASIMGLRNRNRELERQVEGEKKRGRFVVQSMRQQLAGVLGIGEGYLNGDVAVRGPEDEPQGQNDEEMVGDGSRAGSVNGESGDSSPITQKQPGRISSSVAPVIRRGFFLDGRLARRRSSGFGVSKEKKRRRYDSGLGFLDEQGEGEEEEGEMGGDEMMDEIMGVEA